MDPVVRMTSLSSMPPVYPQRRLGGRLVERGRLLAVEGDGAAGQLHPGLAVDALQLGHRAQVGAAVEGAGLDGPDASRQHTLGERQRHRLNSGQHYAIRITNSASQ